MSRRSNFGRGITLLALVSAQFLAMLDSSILNVALPSIKQDLTLTAVGSAWVLNAYFLTFGGFLLLSGRAADLFGRRRMFLLGSTLLVAASGVATLATTDVMLIGARMVQGLGAALLTPAALSLLIVTFTGPAKAKAMSGWGAASAIGGAAGVSVGGLVVGTLGWQAVFVLTGLVSALTALVAARFIPRDEVRLARRFDALGAITVTGAALALAFTILSAADQGRISPDVLAGAVAAVSLGAIFVVVEQHASEPIVPLDLFRNTSVSAGVAVNLLGGAARVACFFLVALYLQEGLRYGPSLAGAAMLPTSVAGFVVSVTVLPRLLARWGATRTMVLGLLALGAAQLWLSRAPGNGVYALDVLPALVLAAAGVALSFTPTTLVITRSIPADRSGIASGIASASAQLGGALGIAAFSAIQASASRGLIEGGAAATEATLGGFAAAFLGAGISALLAVVLGVALLSKKRRGLQKAVASPTGEAVLVPKG